MQQFLMELFQILDSHFCDQIFSSYYYEEGTVWGYTRIFFK